MTTFVQQISDKDCVAACVAMWLDLPYYQVQAMFFSKGVIPARDGSRLEVAMEILQEQGIQVERQFNFYPAYKAILDLPSLNFLGGMHACYYDGKELFDPQAGKPGRIIWTKELLNEKCSWGSTIREVSDSGGK